MAKERRATPGLPDGGLVEPAVLPSSGARHRTHCEDPHLAQQGQLRVGVAVRQQSGPWKCVRPLQKLAHVKQIGTF